MATTTFHSESVRIVPSPNKTLASFYVSTWVIVLARVFFSAIFILSSFHHFQSETVNMAMDQGVPFARLAVPASGVLALLGGLSILFNYKAKIGATLIMIFLVPVTLMMHNFWAVSDPNLQQMQMAMFMKNVAIFGAALLIYQYSPNPFESKNQ